MGALKLESFSHETEIRKGISKFESFEALRVDAYSEGVKSGAAAATKAFEAEKIRSLAPILEALNDLAFAQVEAHQALLFSLKPLIEQLVTSVLPTCAANGLAREVAAVVANACNKSPTSEIEITVAPEVVSAMQAHFATAKADLSIKPNPELDPLQAKVTWRGGFDEVKLNAALAEINLVVNEFFNETQKTGTENA